MILHKFRSRCDYFYGLLLFAASLIEIYMSIVVHKDITISGIIVICFFVQWLASGLDLNFEMNQYEKNGFEKSVMEITLNVSLILLILSGATICWILPDLKFSLWKILMLLIALVQILYLAVRFFSLWSYLRKKRKEEH